MAIDIIIGNRVGSSNKPHSDPVVDPYLIADWNFTLYPDGYYGDIEDLSGHENKPILTGLLSYITNRNGIVDGAFMVNRATAALGGSSTISFRTPSILEDPQTLSFEIYAHFRTHYNEFAPLGLRIIIPTPAETYLVELYAIFVAPPSDVTRDFLLLNLSNMDINSVGAGTHSKVGGLIDSPIRIDGIDDNTLKNEWHHVVFVQLPNALFGYLDGRLTILALRTTTRNYEDKTVKILAGDRLRGDITRVRFWNKALTAAEVLACYNEIASGA